MENAKSDIREEGRKMPSWITGTAAVMGALFGAQALGPSNTAQAGGAINNQIPSIEGTAFPIDKIQTLLPDNLKGKEIESAVADTRKGIHIVLLANGALYLSSFTTEGQPASIQDLTADFDTSTMTRVTEVTDGYVMLDNGKDGDIIVAKLNREVKTLTRTHQFNIPYLSQTQGVKVGNNLFVAGYSQTEEIIQYCVLDPNGQKLIESNPLTLQDLFPKAKADDCVATMALYSNEDGNNAIMVVNGEYDVYAMELAGDGSMIPLSEGESLFHMEGRAVLSKLAISPDAIFALTTGDVLTKIPLNGDPKITVELPFPTQGIVDMRYNATDDTLILRMTNNQVYKLSASDITEPLEAPLGESYTGATSIFSFRNSPTDDLAPAGTPTPTPEPTPPIEITPTPYSDYSTPTPYIEDPTIEPTVVPTPEDTPTVTWAPGDDDDATENACEGSFCLDNGGEVDIEKEEGLTVEHGGDDVVKQTIDGEAVEDKEVSVKYQVTFESPEDSDTLTIYLQNLAGETTTVTLHANGTSEEMGVAHEVLGTLAPGTWQNKSAPADDDHSSRNIGTASCDIEEALKIIGESGVVTADFKFPDGTEVKDIQVGQTINAPNYSVDLPVLDDSTSSPETPTTAPDNPDEAIPGGCGCDNTAINGRAMDTQMALILLGMGLYGLKRRKFQKN